MSTIYPTLLGFGEYKPLFPPTGTLSMIAGSISEGLSLSILAMAILIGWSKLLPFAVAVGMGRIQEWAWS